MAVSPALFGDLCADYVSIKRYARCPGHPVATITYARRAKDMRGSYLHARASFEAPYEKSHRQVRSPRPYGIRSDEATEATLHRLEAQGVQGRGPDGQELDAALCDSAQGWAANACGYSEVSDSGHEGQASADAAGLHSCLAHCSLGSGVGGAEPSGDADNREPELNEATLFVGDLAKEVNELDLRRAFTEHGQVLSVDIKRDRRTRSSLGYGFVQYASRRCVRLLAGPGDPGTDSAGVAAGSARAPRPAPHPSSVCVLAARHARASERCRSASLGAARSASAGPRRTPTSSWATWTAASPTRCCGGRSARSALWSSRTPS